MESIIISPKKLNFALFWAFSFNLEFKGHQIYGRIATNKTQYEWILRGPNNTDLASWYFDRDSMLFFDTMDNISVLVNAWSDAKKYFRDFV